MAKTIIRTDKAPRSPIYSQPVKANGLERVMHFEP